MIPTPTTAHLLRHGHAMLLVPCDMPDEKFAGPTWYHPMCEAPDGELFPAPRAYGIYGCGWDRIAPHAPGDVIQAGDQQARVVEVLPPVQFKTLDGTSAVLAGFLPDNDCPQRWECESEHGYGLGSFEDDLSNAAGGKPWQECHCALAAMDEWWTANGGQPTTWVWRERVTLDAAEAAESEDPNEQ